MKMERLLRRPDVVKLFCHSTENMTIVPHAGIVQHRMIQRSSRNALVQKAFGEVITAAVATFLKSKNHEQLSTNILLSKTSG